MGLLMKPKTPAEIEAIRQSGKNVAAALKLMAESARAGMTTAELEKIGEAELRRLGSEPVRVDGYPAICCTSVNNAIVHAIPSTYRMQEGDLVGIDFWASYQGMITDTAVTIAIGEASAEGKRLIKTTERAMYAGIDAVKNGAHIGDISAAVQAVLDKEKLGIVRDLAGHGVGHELHEDPWVPNFGSAGQGTTLKTGMTIAIEPMATLGKGEVVFEADGWTVSSADGSLSAHFEHTVLVTDDGCEILTQWS